MEEDEVEKQLIFEMRADTYWADLKPGTAKTRYVAAWNRCAATAR